MQYFFKSLILIYLITLGTNAISQCGDFDILIDDEVCSGNSISISNSSSGLDSYSWDFCPGDMSLTPLANNVNNYPDIGRSDGLEIIRESNKYYGFIIGISGKLFRLDFGTSLSNTPLINDLGVIVGGFDLSFIKDSNNIWHGYIASGNSKIYRVDFDSGIESGISFADLGNYSGIISSPRGIRTQKKGSDIYVLVTSSNLNTLSIIKFNGGVNGVASSRSIDITGGSQVIGIDIVNECNQNYAIVSSVSNRKFHRVSLGDDLMDNLQTSIEEITSLAGLQSYELDIIVENNNYYLEIPLFNGPLIQANFSNSITNSPTYEDLGNFGILDKTLGAEFINDSSAVTGFIYNYITFDLSRISYPNNCAANIPYAEQITPSGVYYNAPGEKFIEIKGYNVLGDTKVTLDSILVLDLPNTGFTFTKACLGQSTEFLDTSSSVNGIIDNWLWDFGGLGSSTSQNPTFDFTSIGTYDVGLTIIDPKGCSNTLVTQVKIYNSNDIQPGFSYPSTICTNSGIQFSDESIFIEDQVQSWLWNFNGEGSSVIQNPGFTFLSSGTKNISLTVTGLSGCSYSISQQLDVPAGPLTNFTNNNVCNSQTTTFNDLTIGTNLTAWSWDFGDGNFSTDQNPTHTYSTPGKYPVTLTVDNNLGCSTSKTDTVYNHAIPVVNFTYDLPCSSSPIQFSDQSIVQDAGIVVWEWDFGDGNTSTDRNPQHTYGQTGDFTVQLKAYSQFGCVDSTESVITVIQGPEVDFEWDKGCIGETTSFADLTNSFGQPMNWTWLIDNNVFTQQHPPYTFSSPGTYTIDLSVTTTDNLCAQTISKEITVEDTPSTSFDNFDVCENDTVTFYDTTPAAIAQWEWKIDGTLKSVDSVMHESLLPGNYQVSLATTTTSGCTGASSQNINIVGSPTAQFTASTLYGAAPLTIQFNNESVGAESYYWDFGDASNSSSTEINPEFIFTNIGIYNVTLIAAGGQNCADTTGQIIEVVEAVHGLSLDAITPLDAGSIALTMSNMGSYTYNEDNLQLVFTLDNGAEIPEPFATILYPQKTINYMPSITLGDIKNSKVLCAELQFIDANPLVVLDKNCLNLNSQATIADAYPNPANDFINLSVVLPESGNVSITLIDRTGAVIMNDNFESAQQGLNNYTIDATSYRSGLYIVKIETESEVKKMKIVIDR